MKNLFVVAITAMVLTTSCEEAKDPFLIQDNSIGLLSKEIRVSQLDSVFALDSIVKTTPDGEVIVAGGDIEVYDKAGALLMVLTPAIKEADSSKIKTIQIVDSRFATDKGLNSKSTFKTIKDNYTVNQIFTTMSSVIVSLNETKTYVIIDKKELPESLRYTSNNIEITQIPEEATFKFFMLEWDQTVQEKQLEDE